MDALDCAETVFSNAMVVTPTECFSGTVIVAGGEIVGVETGRSRLRSAIDCEGDFLIPGLVDLHTDSVERHYEELGADALAAVMTLDGYTASVGVTTVFQSLTVHGYKQGFNRGKAVMPLIEAVERCDGENLLRIDHRVHLRCELSSPDLGDKLASYLENTRVGLISVMHHAPGLGQRRNLDPEQYDEMARRNYRERGVPEEEIEGMLQYNRRVRSADEAFLTANRKIAADLASAASLAFASHDDETEAQIAQSVAVGAVIAEFPTTIEAAVAARQAGMHVVMGAPNTVRGGSKSGNVSARNIVQAEALSILVSDYLPVTLLQAVFRLTDPDLGLSVPAAIGTATSAPAEAVGLLDRGRIEIGKRADIIRVRRSLPSGWAQIRGIWAAGRRIA